MSTELRNAWVDKETGLDDHGRGDSRSMPKNPDVKHGTVVAKSKYGTITAVRHDETKPARFIGHRKSGEAVGTGDSTHTVADKLREPKNREQFHSGYRHPDTEWKWSTKGLKASEENMKQPNVVFEALSAGRGTWEDIDGVTHYVAPIVAMVQGVIHAMNAKRPEFVPADQLSTYGWDGRPVFINHPMVDDVPVASFHPKVAGTNIGFTRNPSVTGEGDDRKLVMQVCLVKEKLTPEMLAMVDSDEPFNVSMGAFVSARKKEGEYKGKKYYSEWHDIDPDHMALLPATKGACSWEMGCGVRAAGELRAAWMNKDGTDDHGRAAEAHAAAGNAHSAAAAAHEAAHQGKGSVKTAHNASANSQAATEHAGKMSQKTGMGTSSHNTSAKKEADSATEHAASDNHANAAAAHTQAASHHYDQAANHARMKMHAAEENQMTHCYAAWLEPGEETDALLLTLRDISQDMRDKLPKEDFAGPNESFPIVEAGDVSAAAHALGRAKGNRNDIKRRIIAIAYRKGFEASLPEDWKKKSDQKAASMFARAMLAVRDVFRPSVDANEMTSNQLNTKLYEALKELEPRCSQVIDVFPVTDPTHVVYQCYNPPLDPMGYGMWEQYERSFTLSDAGVVTLSDTRIEVETVIRYEPVEGASPTAAEARVTDAPCGCKSKATAASTSETEAVTMEKKDRIKALIAASNGMFTDADMKTLEGATDEQLARYEAAAESTRKTITDAAAAVTAAAAKEKTPEAATFEQLLAAAPAGVRDAINGQVKNLADKKDATIKVLTDSGKCKFTKEQLAGFDQPTLDNLVTLAGVTAAVDHSLILPPAQAGGDAPFIAAQTNEGFNEKVKAKNAAKGKK